jgi:glucose-1-phosphate thymidylyltransferase
MKGIILAGGTGTRLWPVTKSTSKQLLPIYDKPLIYYPIATLMLSGIREILIITTPHEQERFKELLGDGHQFGVEFLYTIQPEPNGLAEAFIIGREFIDNSPVTLILGDNLFYGSGITEMLTSAIESGGSTVFSYQVSNPQDYGVIYFDDQNKPLKVIEKPNSSTSNLAITGLYVFEGDVATVASGVNPSNRGELEITSVIQHYLENQTLQVRKLSRGMAWLDTGNPDALHDAASFVKVIEERTGQKIACLEEIAWRNQWITSEELRNLANDFGNASYGRYLLSLIS